MVDTILQSGVDFVIIVKHENILHKIGLLRTKKIFKIYPICLASLLKISKLLNKIDFNNNPSDEQSFIDYASQQIVANMNIMPDIIALAILNKENYNKFYYKWLVKFLFNNLDASEMFQLFQLVLKQMGTNDFLASLVSIKGINLIETQTTGKS